MIVGCLGGGQLGRMLAEAGGAAGVEFRFFDPAEDACAARFGQHIRGDYTDHEALSRFADGLELVTYEFENVPIDAARFLIDHQTPVHPPPDSLEVAQNRIREKEFFSSHSIQTPRWKVVRIDGDLDAAIEKIGLPLVLKTTSGGYDGKGQLVMCAGEQRVEALALLAAAGELIAEQMVPFTRELSQISARTADGRIVHYPLMENHHREGILRLSIGPAPVADPAIEKEARRAMESLLNALSYVGVLTVEFFEAGGQLLANEMAPRVHNSGHGTREGCEASQFLNHVLAISNQPLQSPTPRGVFAMVNCIGAIPEETGGPWILTDYEKSLRPGRKVGHLAALFEDYASMSSALHELNQRTDIAFLGDCLK